VRKVLIYSLLLVAGLIISQFISPAAAVTAGIIRLLTMIALSFIMIHVGYEFEIDKSRPRQYAWDYFVAFTAAAFPWVFCALYFVFALAPRELWDHPDLWKASLLEGRFASPTSAGVLFSMLAAAGLGATWVFNKARVLAIFDDLDTILLMIPLKIMMVGMHWQLGVIVIVIAALLWAAWTYLHRLRWPISWPWVLAYSVVIAAVSEAIYLASKVVNDTVPVHLEVLLPAFVLGCLLARPAGADPHSNDLRENVEEGPEGPVEQRVSTIISACFMILVGLSMPPFVQSKPGADASAHGGPAVLKFEGVAPEVLEEKNRFPGWDVIALHVLGITFLANLGKMFPAFCYRRQASLRERLAVSIGMWPRGEVGAGVLVISLSYGLGGPAITVAVLSLALNLLCTGLFIVAVKKLIATPALVPQPEEVAV
jgi:Kef-type K+ transport system membrane component KefB